MSDPQEAQQPITWIIEPHDPLIVRDGRPFNNTPGVRAYSQPFPPPSVIAGGIRTRAGMDNGHFDSRLVEDVKKIAIRGPLLVWLDDESSITEKAFFASAPADAVLFEQRDAVSVTAKPVAQRRRLLPVSPTEGQQHDLSPAGDSDLLLVGPHTVDPSKPIKDPPRFWHWKAFETWLLADAPEGLHAQAQSLHQDEIVVADLGIFGPPLDQRTHVSIDAASQTADEGMLFQTRGLQFTHVPAPDPAQPWRELNTARRLALAVQADYREAEHVKAQPNTPLIAPLGGERRLAHWRTPPATWPQCPASLIQHIAAQKACRVVLLTPAVWSHGFYPEALLTTAETFDVTATLRAVAIHRPQVISGWDFATSSPKPTRRLAPAGTVLFLSLDSTADNIRRWATSFWMTCVSDDDQDCRDGFGLAVLGTWSGLPITMQFKEQSNEPQTNNSAA